MDTRTGEIISDKELNERLKALPPKERAKEKKFFAPLAGIQEAELEELKLMRPSLRLLWLKNNSLRLVKNCGANEAKKIIAICALGLTRKQLREAGIKVRPHQARVRAGV